jgi:hypothetical protein
MCSNYPLAIILLYTYRRFFFDIFLNHHAYVGRTCRIFGSGAKSDPGNQERKTQVDKLDLNKAGNSLISSKSIVSNQSGSDKVIKRSMAHMYYQLYDVYLFLCAQIQFIIK